MESSKSTYGLAVLLIAYSATSAMSVSAHEMTSPYGIVYQQCERLIFLDRTGRETVLDATPDHFGCTVGLGAAFLGRAALSPDGRRYAYIRADENLVIGNLSSHEIIQVTSFPESRNPKHKDRAIVVSGWARDGTKLLYRVSAGRCGLLGEGDCLPPVQVDEGYFLFDLTSSSSTKLAKLPGFEFWMPDSKAIAFYAREPSHRLLRYSLDSGKTEMLADFSDVIPSTHSHVGQFDISVSNSIFSFVVVTFTPKGGAEITAYVSPIRPIRFEPAMTDVQFPRLSPGGKWISFNKIHNLRDGVEHEIYVGRLDDSRVRDIKAIPLKFSAASTTWLSDDLLAVTEFTKGSVRQFDAATLNEVTNGRK